MYSNIKILKNEIKIMENKPSTPQPELPHHNISGLTGEQADKFVELAYANKRFADVVSDDPNGLEGLNARDQIRVNDDKLRQLANVAIGEPELAAPTENETREDDRRKPTMVVNPRDGRIVQYGQMTHGNHPRGGMIVRR